MFDSLKSVFKQNKNEHAAYIFKTDEQETRSISLLNKYSDFTEAINDNPDWASAYLRAAYPNRNSDDHQNARPEFLKEALGKVKQESLIYTRLSCYDIWAKNYENAFKEAIQALIMAGKSRIFRQQPGSMVQCLIFLGGVLKKHRFEKETKAIVAMNDGYELGTKEATDVNKAIAYLSPDSYRSMIQAGIKALSKAGLLGK
jgi:hypothetical protein